MNYLNRGMAAGVAGALVLAGILLLNAEAGALPEMDFVALLGRWTATGALGGWILHFVVGAVWGALFAWLDPDLPGDSLRQRGILFAVIAWFVMMIGLMPLAGMGVFGLEGGVLVPLATLVLHLVFGAVMGGAYDWLIRQSRPFRYRTPRLVPHAALATRRDGADAQALPASLVPPVAHVKRPKIKPRRSVPAPSIAVSDDMPASDPAPQQPTISADDRGRT